MADGIKVLIADDQLVLAKELANVLESDKEIVVTGIACDGFDALKQMERMRPDVVLMDIRMPNMNGVVATREIKTKYPEVKVLILTTFDDSDYILNAVNYGASGYLLKSIGANALVGAVKDAYKGDMILPSQIARRIAAAAKDVSADREIKLKRTFELSDREVEIALMMYEGFTNRQISSALNISEGTARNYISAIYEKTGSESRSSFFERLKGVL